MEYYAQYENSKLTGIGTGGTSGETITKEEYDRLLTEIRAKAQLEDDVYSGAKTLEEVPAEWQAEISERVNERRRREKEREEALKSPEREISAEEAQKIMLEGV